MTSDELIEERAISAGGVILRKVDSAYETVLVGRKVDRAWLLPKGTPNEHESLERTARREVSEETGLDVKIRAPVGTIHYSFSREGRRIEKTVLFFLMSALGGDVRLHDHEYDYVRWVPIDEARRLLKYETYRDLLDRAIKEHQRLGYG